MFVIFREECIFTIDPATARDLDDALSCKQLSDGETAFLSFWIFVINVFFFHILYCKSILY